MRLLAERRARAAAARGWTTARGLRLALAAVALPLALQIDAARAAHDEAATLDRLARARTEGPPRLDAPSPWETLADLTERRGLDRAALGEIAGLIAETGAARAARDDQALGRATRLLYERIAAADRAALDRDRARAQQRLDRARGRARAAAVAAVIALALAQVYAAARSRRRLHPPLLLATGLVVLAAVATSDAHAALLGVGALALAAAGLWGRWQEHVVLGQTMSGCRWPGRAR